METELEPCPTAIWACKVGSLHAIELPPAADGPMREAVYEAFYQLTGEFPQFTFSGWSAELTEGELAVVENRLPNEIRTQSTATLQAKLDAAEARVKVLEHTSADLLQHVDWLTSGLPDMLENNGLTDEEGLIGAAIDAANSARQALTQTGDA